MNATPSPAAPRFPETYCSSCGAELGPGDSGVAECSQHASELSPADKVVADPRYGLEDWQ